MSEVDRESLNQGRARYLTDPRDTATPYEMAKLLGRLQIGDLLPRAETELLLDYMLQTTTGARRIKGRLPADTPVAHKTGSTAVVVNDAGIITLPAGQQNSGARCAGRVRCRRFERHGDGTIGRAARGRDF